MKLIDLLKGFSYEHIKGDINEVVSGIAIHSKKVSEGSIYICIKGYETDGHLYIKDAINNGAKVIVVQENQEITEDVTVIKMDDTRLETARLVGKFYGNPTEALRLIGVTGTNGKTSITYLIANILRACGYKIGLLGTIEKVIGDKVLPSARTTEDAVTLQGLFKDMVDEGVSHSIMEVSSHALALHRVEGCLFDVGIFTNLTHDHLDFHRTFENYRDAKLKLFLQSKVSIINIDDKHGPYIFEHATSKVKVSYGVNNAQAMVNATDIKSDISGAKFVCHIEDKKYDVSIQTPGKFSVYNALAAIATLRAFDIPMDKIIEALRVNSMIEGRFQQLTSRDGFSVIVDYAHTPDSLENVIKTVNEFKTGKAITVFGCGGDRDTSKRPEMGETSVRLSDYTIVTSDNPRTEDPQKIIDDILEGINQGDDYEVVIDREKAIKKAVKIAKPGDVVLIAGKGHEDYQVIGTKKIHFSDIEIVNDLLKENKRK